MELIDKSDLVEEIERKIKQYKNERNTIIVNSDNHKELSSRIIMCSEILSFINTLETKDIDLEKEYEEFVVDDPILGNFITNDTMGMELAKHFFELGLRSNKEQSLKFTGNMNNKIQQYLLWLVKPLWDDTIDSVGLKKDDIIAWIEKHGQEKHLSEPIKDYQGSFTCWNNAHDFRPEHLQRCICYDKYMGDVYCYVYDDISKYWCTQTTEEHDPDGDNHICDYADYRVTAWMSLPDTSFYPSKSRFDTQGEQKSTWSEEDERNLKCIMKIIKEKAFADYDIDEDNNMLGIYGILENWMKSIKQRMEGKV